MKAVFGVDGAIRKIWFDLNKNRAVFLLLKIIVIVFKLKIRESPPGTEKCIVQDDMYLLIGMLLNPLQS